MTFSNLIRTMGLTGLTFLAASCFDAVELEAQSECQAFSRGHGRFNPAATHCNEGIDWVSSAFEEIDDLAGQGKGSLGDYTQAVENAIEGCREEYSESRAARRCRRGVRLYVQSYSRMEDRSDITEAMLNLNSQE